MQFVQERDNIRRRGSCGKPLRRVHRTLHRLFGNSFDIMIYPFLFCTDTRSYSYLIREGFKYCLAYLAYREEQLIFVTTVTTGSGVLFFKSVYFLAKTTQNFAYILAKFGYFVANCRTFWCTITRLNSMQWCSKIGKYQVWKISGQLCKSFNFSDLF